MRCCVAGLVVLALAAPVARADDGTAPPAGEIDTEAAPPDDADAHAAVSAALGAGSDGGAIALAELRAEWTGPAFAIGLGGRLRWRDRALVRDDWRTTGDWLGLIRRLEVAHRGETVAGSIGAGRLAPVVHGAVVDGYSTAALVDHRAPGAIARVRSRAVSIDASVDDVTAPTLVAGAVEVALGGRWRGVLDVAVDPGTDPDTGDAAPVMVAATGGIEVAVGIGVGAAAPACRTTAGCGELGGTIDAGVIAGPHGDVAGVVRGEVSGAHGWLHASARLEARAFTGAAVASPFGPLWPVERERMIDADDRGVAAAVAARVAVDGVGSIEGGWRARGERGDLVTARLALPWWRHAQAGGYAAIGEDDAIVAAEARVVWSPRWFSAVEVGRGYRRDEAGVLDGVWQLGVWFGATAGW